MCDYDKLDAEVRRQHLQQFPHCWPVFFTKMFERFIKNQQSSLSRAGCQKSCQPQGEATDIDHPASCLGHRIDRVASPLERQQCLGFPPPLLERDVESVRLIKHRREASPDRPRYPGVCPLLDQLGCGLKDRSSVLGFLRLVACRRVCFSGVCQGLPCEVASCLEPC